eukprot:TRINITY_DN864_c0_g2_i1.p1 TRINITY_DN864_c0_g2~~TRINITY_DN864_c0_g2_i1.p1  ORF type:complete len:376 (+),score=79.42 TRINITY_DN864_c0_g2_i1:1-1128(+)
MYKEDQGAQRKFGLGQAPSILSSRSVLKFLRIDRGCIRTMSLAHLGKENVENTAQNYASMYKEDQGAVEKRKESYATIAKQYYDLVTDFYEYGWGQSFHFAPRHAYESIPSSLARHELFLALRLGLKKGMKVLDVGCGIGGPMREIARFSGANVIGININDYQIKRGTQLNQQAGLSSTCSFLKADFLKIPLEEGSVDAIYALDATCHAPDKVSIYSEMYRLLKPGGYFAAYEWCVTDEYDATNPVHQEIKKNIEIGDGLPNLDSTEDVLAALQKCGFELVEHKDLAIVDAINPVAWYQPFAPGLSLQSFRVTAVGKWITHYLVAGLEKIGFAPKGTTSTHEMLMLAHDGMVRGGKTGIFTPMFFFMVRKPLSQQ